jgi:hypothetical protein
MNDDMSDILTVLEDVRIVETYRLKIRVRRLELIVWQTTVLQICNYNLA